MWPETERPSTTVMRPSYRCFTLAPMPWPNSAQHRWHQVNINRQQFGPCFCTVFTPYSIWVKMRCDTPGTRSQGARQYHCREAGSIAYVLKEANRQLVIESHSIMYLQYT